jgi:hypothetical protein
VAVVKDDPDRLMDRNVIGGDKTILIGEAFYEI